MSATSSGGKYTRELKLRVLEHYFRNGGDVFGNKQATSKKFGVDSKTINRFLKIHELVRMARKNAKSSGKSSSANDSFKEPLAPGGSGRPQRQAAKPSVRINLPDQPDEAITNQTSEGNLSSVGKLLKIFELGSQEIRDLLLAECDLVYECRVCRGLFRSLANLLAHKRRYCTRAYCETRQVFGDGPGQSLSAPSDGVLVLPLPAAIDRLPEVRLAAATAARAAAARPLPPLRLETLPGTQAALAQTLGQPERTVGQQLAELAQLEASRGRTVRLGPDGKVVESGDEAEEPGPESAAAAGDDGRHVCKLCNTTFSTRKTLSYHVRSLHASTRVYYPCSFCSAAFINMFSVERHLQKAHKKTAEEIDTLKEAIRQKSFQRSVSQADLVSPGTPTKVTSFEWKCRQCGRRYLSLPVGLQHVQTVHPQYAAPRAGLVRVCRVLRQPTDAAAVSTRSSSGRVTPLHEPDDEDDDAAAADDGDQDRLAFNKANLLKKMDNGHERCVLCQKEFAGHVQACGHLRLHDQSQIETYLGQKVRLTRKKKPVAVLQPEEEYELDEAAAAAAGTDDEEGEESDEEGGAGPAQLASVQSRGYPVHMVAADQVRRRDFIHADAEDASFACTLCESRFERVKAARAHMARHSLAEVRQYVARFAVDGMVGVPMSPSSPPAAAAEPAEDDADDGDSVDTDIEAGAKLLVSCKLWSPDKNKDMDGNSASEGDEGEDMEEDQIVNEAESELLAKEIDGEIVDKWEAIRRKGERLRCVVCNRTFMKTISAEQHLRADHTFEEIRAFVNNWPLKGIRVPPRKGSGDANAEAAAGVDDEEMPAEDTFKAVSSEKSPDCERVGTKSAAALPGRQEAPTAAAKQEPLLAPPPPPLQKGVKRVLEGALPAGKLIKIARRAPQPGVARLAAPVAPKLGTIGPNTKILKISRSDLLMRRAGGACSCLVCDNQFATHALACAHMRQHSDADIRNFIKTRGREFLPAFEQKSRNRPNVAPFAGTAGSSLQARAKQAGTPVAGAPENRTLHANSASAPAATISQGKASSATEASATPRPNAPASAAGTMADGSSAGATPAAAKTTAGNAAGPPSEPPAESPAGADSKDAAADDHRPEAPAVGDGHRPEAPAVGDGQRSSRRLQSRSSETKEAGDSESGVDEEEEKDRELERDDAVREFEMFDKVQLLQRRGDSTKCLLCRRVFTKYWSACGHLSHHSAEQVQEWRDQMCLKAAALLKKAARPPAVASDVGAEQRSSVQAGAAPQPVGKSEPSASAASSAEPGLTSAEVKKGTAESVLEPSESARKIESVVKPAVLAPYKQKSQRSLENVAKRLKGAHFTMERVDYEPKVPKQVQTTKPATKIEPRSSNMDELSSRSASAASSNDDQQAKPDAAASKPANVSQTTSGKAPPSTKQSPAVKASSAAKADVIGTPSSSKDKPPAVANAVAAGAAVLTPAAEEKPPSAEKQASSEPSPADKLSSSPRPPPAEKPAPVDTKVLPAQKASPIQKPPSAATGKPSPGSRTMKLAISMPALSVSSDKPSSAAGPHLSGISTVVVGGKQLQALKLSVVPTAGEGPLAGRTIMRLAPGMKLPVTAVPVSGGLMQRVLRPIAPKAAAGSCTPPQSPLQLQQLQQLPPQPRSPAAGSCPGSPRPRPPPLLRAPLMQAVNAAGRSPVQPPTPKSAMAAARPAVAASDSGAEAAPAAAKATTTSTNDQGKEAGADAGKPAAAGKEKSDTNPAKSKPETQVTESSKSKDGTSKPSVTPGDSKLTLAPALKQDDAGGKARPLHTYQKKQSVAASSSASAAARSSEVKSEGKKPATSGKPASVATTPSPKVSVPAAKASAPVHKAVTASSKPASAPAKASPASAKSPMVNKRSFIPEVRPMRSWSPADAAARGNASDDGLPQTRARAEAAMAARVRQTRRKSVSAASDRK